MAGVNFDTIESKSLQLGDNKFEQGTMPVAAGATVKAGTLLKRSGERKFAKAESGDTAIAVVPFDMENASTTALDFGFRAIIGGMVRKDMLNLNGDPITSAQADSLRDYGIVVVETHDVSRNP
jgi:hypothetical protein